MRWESGARGKFGSPSRLAAEEDASRAHHTELGVWLQLISMVIELSRYTTCMVRSKKMGGAQSQGLVAFS